MDTESVISGRKRGQVNGSLFQGARRLSYSGAASSALRLRGAGVGLVSALTAFV